MPFALRSKNTLVVLFIFVSCRSAWSSPPTPQNPSEALLSTDNAYDPIPSPDGKFIAYVRTGWGRRGGSGGFGRSNLVSEVAVMSADGTPVTKSAIAETFISGWTPDGTQLICFRDWDYFLASLDGTHTGEGHVFPVAGVQTPFNQPEWVAYSPALPGIVWSHMVDASHWAIETSDRIVASTQSRIGERAVPSPDGRYIATFSEFTPTELWVYDTQIAKWADLGKIVIHPARDWSYLEPRWNPWFADSSRLAFFSGSTLVISTPDGRQKTEQVVEGEAGLPVPSPNGLSIAYVTSEVRPLKGNPSQQFWGGTTLWVVSTKVGSNPRAVTQKSEDATYDLNWLNNGTIVFDRVADEIFYRQTRIWKVNIPQ